MLRAFYGKVMFFGEHPQLLVYIIVCPLVFLAGFVDSIAGGGGLISLPAYMIAGLPSHNAIATNKLSSTMGTSISVYRYAKNGFMPWKEALVCAIFAILGSQGGARLSLLIGDEILKIIMLVLLPLTAVFVMSKKSLKEAPEELPFGKTLFLSVCVALVMGFYDGFYGPGTGAFLLLFLTAVAKMKLTTANGITKAINFSSNVSALAVFLLGGKAIIPLGLTAGLFSILGNYLGSKTFIKKGVNIVKPVMLTVLVICFIKILSEIL